MAEGQIARNIAQIRERIAAAAAHAGRDGADITLVAVTKTVDAQRIEQAYQAGIRDFGESYVQEALTKLGQPPLDMSDIHWHFIGHLQTNKVRDVVGRFTLIQSVDSLRLAQAIGQRAERAGQTEAILLEIKLDPVATKFGFAPEEVAQAAEQVARIPGIRLRGLMGIAPYASDPEAARPFFQKLNTLFSQLPPDARQTLSMGMSGDYEVAIEEGATLIRIGSALFGPRR